MSVIDDYMAAVDGDEKAVLRHMYAVVRQAAPDAAEEAYYGMPAFKYNGQGLISIVAAQKFLSLYPFCDKARLGIDLSAYDGTKGSIHFSPEKPISDNLLRQILTARIKLITG